MTDMTQDVSMWLVLAPSSAFTLYVFIFFVIKTIQAKNKPDYTRQLHVLPKTETAVKKVEPRKVEKPQLKVVTQVEKVSLKDALSKSRKNFWSHLSFSNTDKIDTILEQIEEALYLGDVGPQTVSHLVGRAQEHFKSEKLTEESLKTFLKNEMSEILGKRSMNKSVYAQLKETTTDSSDPQVLMVVGVNGAGKTTTIGKLAQNLASEGKKVLIAAGDTFRAAAGEQLKVWTDRAQAEIFFPEGVKDPSAVAYDAVAKAISQKFDVCIIDTAGRLHTQDNLMAELEKVNRVVGKILPNAPQHRWIVLDANSGQNALFQAKSFNEKLNLTGVVLTKLDGTAKGGMALAVANELNVPIRFIGVGEKAQDLRPFEQSEFVDSLI